MAFSAGDNTGGPMAEINVTPLVDVMLVLLIIFMITTPLMQNKTQVELPRADLKKKDEAKLKATPIQLAVKEDGSLFWNDEPITKDILESRLSSAAQLQPQPPLNLRGDRTTKMRTINEITKIAQAQGMLDIGYVATKPKK
ncbi:biopolymer transporter ExbD [Luteimonas gilva]|jgi:biopolymer transport protein ExbD|uniref:Biopolymer transporter ExbD n=1 Tax=Luteimonas gilva TaxID=2572684 RepID=A0A4U5JNP7_9GAMM|nr:biopolymer transporter ExbD [Luteimonas gilva]TKR30141.1 biopolymer transporter ExbD [Luteimonas gilva]